MRIPFHVQMCLAAAMCLAAPAWGDEECEKCGPGPHWVDSCTTGSDTIPATCAAVGIDLNLDNVADTTLMMCGPVSISRSDPLNASVNFPTVTGPAGHVGPDVIDTEIVSMNLTGGGASLRAGAGGVPALDPSLGAIAETSDNTLADSFFDVFFEIDLGGGQFAYNQEALRVEAVITCVPPGASFVYLSTTPISLFTAPSGGSEIARLVTTQHDNFPACPNGVCEAGENACSCSLDCPQPVCGDSCCSAGENSTNCAADCGDIIPTMTTWSAVVLVLVLLVGGTLVFGGIRFRAARVKAA